MVKQSTAKPKPLAWLVEFDQMVKPNVWEPVGHVVYEEPEGHYAGCATPIATQRELETLLRKPDVTQFRKH